MRTYYAKRVLAKAALVSNTVALAATVAAATCVLAASPTAVNENMFLHFPSVLEDTFFLHLKINFVFPTPSLFGRMLALILISPTPNSDYLIKATNEILKNVP